MWGAGRAAGRFPRDPGAVQIAPGRPKPSHKEPHFAKPAAAHLGGRLGLGREKGGDGTLACQRFSLLRRHSARPRALRPLTELCVRPCCPDECRCVAPASWLRWGAARARTNFQACLRGSMRQLGREGLQHRCSRLHSATSTEADEIKARRGRAPLTWATELLAAWGCLPCCTVHQLWCCSRLPALIRLPLALPQPLPPPTTGERCIASPLHWQ